MKKSHKQHAAGCRLMAVLLLFAFCFLTYTVSFAQGHGVIETLKFKDADIRVVLQAITQKAVKNDKHVNIILGSEIKGLVTVDLENVDWQTALEAVLKTYDYGYEWIGKNIILVDTLDKIADRRKKAAEAKVAEPLETKVFPVHYSKAKGIAPALQSLLSERGKITINERTNSLIISDTHSNLRTISETIEKLDKETYQIYIEAKFVEVNEDKLKELGFDWSTGTGGATSVMLHRKLATVYYDTVDENGYPIKSTYEDVATAKPVPLNSKGTKALSGQILPSEDKGLELLFQKLSGTKFEAVLSALEDNNTTNVISNPKIMTAENKEAKILVGTKVPIPEYSYSKDTGQEVISGYSEEKVGISFSVNPKVIKEGMINLKIHPEVSEITSWTGPNNERPIVSTREAETELVVKDGETLMIGGLVKDKLINSITGVPILKDIPILGLLFQKKSTSKEKIDLIIFLTAKIVKPSQATPSKILATKEISSQTEKK